MQFKLALSVKGVIHLGFWPNMLRIEIFMFPVSLLQHRKNFYKGIWMSIKI